MRHEDWPSRLVAFLAERQTRPFAWGSNDCVLFAADAVQAITGVDLAAEYRGQYSTALGAARIRKERGGIDALPEAVGLSEVPALMAQRGDVVLVDEQTLDGPALCVVTGATVAGPGAQGMVQLPLQMIRRAWRVVPRAANESH